MRAGIVAGAVLLVVSVAFVRLDADATLGGIGVGSTFGILEPTELRSVPIGGGCGPALLPFCAAQFAYSPGKTVTVWFSVRNESPVAVTLDGIPQKWLDASPPSYLWRPVGVFDGGDSGRDGTSGTGRRRAFEAMTLRPGDERLIGVELRTTDDVAYACGHWDSGTAVGISTVPVAWHWMLARHEDEIALARSVAVMAPTVSDCHR